MANKLFAFCDSPTCSTGFGRVAQNLLKRWKPHFSGGIDVWGINYAGWPHNLDYVDNIYPPSFTGPWGWLGVESFRNNLRQLSHGGYTHFWCMQDVFNLVKYNYPSILRQACESTEVEFKGKKVAKGKILSLLYYPVDAPLETAWTDIIRHIHVPVAYTHYGKREAISAMPASPVNIEVLPHGVDTSVYHPLENREQIRADVLEFLAPKGFCGKDDFLMLNVNQHQPRKDAARSLMLLKELIGLGMPAKLIMHCNRYSPVDTPDNCTDLELVANQIGLRYGKDWVHTTQCFSMNTGMLSEDELCMLYNSADLTVSSSLGEGWGLSLTDSLACGTPVAAPFHTAWKENGQRLKDEFGMEDDSVTQLPVEPYGIALSNDNSRVRYPLDVYMAASMIEIKFRGGKHRPRITFTDKAKDWLSWDRIANEWLKLMKLA